MNQSRINLEEENAKLQDRLFILMSKFGLENNKLLIEEGKSDSIADTGVCGDGEGDESSACLEAVKISNITVNDTTAIDDSVSSLEEKEGEDSVSNDGNRSLEGIETEDDESQMQMVIEEMNED